METNEKDIKLFELLHGSQQGDMLVDYLERVKAWVCDVRNQSTLSNQERIGLTQVIDEFLVSKIKLVNPKKNVKNEFV